jgi:hypothetical protein
MATFKRSHGRWPEFGILIHDGRRVQAVSIEGGRVVNIERRKPPVRRAARSLIQLGMHA